ncbi:MAG: alpha/beta hydrolase [Alphaproteobacteria bacterium]|nr:alpha/beta hydrolase [Alphaproteobacteria bacterium]
MPEIIFNGPEGRLEGRYQPGNSEESPLALILHPHPQMPNGNMNNRITYTLFQTFSALGFAVLRFNFRGVGRSQGVYDEGQGELGDAAAALDWLQMMNRNAKTCWIAGYSFGAWIGMQLLMRRPEISGFISVAPPANSKDFSFLAPCPASGLIVHGGEDELIPEASVAALADKLSGQRNIHIRYAMFPHAGHDFENHLKDISLTVRDYVTDIMTRKHKKSVRGKGGKKIRPKEKEA